MSTTVFSQDQLNAIVKETIPSNLPDGHAHAIVGTVDQDGAQVVAGFTLGANQEWQVDGVFRHTWSGDNAVGAQVIYSW
jgi:hypothetical protein